MRSETGRPSDAVKSARVERLRAGNLSSDAYACGFMETQMLMGGRKPSRFWYRNNLDGRRRLSRLARTPARGLCDIRCFRRTKPHTAPFPFPIKYRQNCRTRHLFDDVDQHTHPPRPLIVQGISHPPQGVSNWHSTCI